MAMDFRLIFNKHDTPVTDTEAAFRRQMFFGPRAGTVDMSSENITT